MPTAGLLLERLTIAILALIALVMLAVPALIWGLTLTGVLGSPPTGLVTLQTVDVSRFDTDEPAALTLRLADALIPAPDRAGRPSAVILAPSDSWEAFAAAAPLVRLVDGPILAADAPDLGPAITRLRPSGVAALGGAGAIAVGVSPPPGLAAVAIAERGVAPGPAELAAAVDQLRMRLPGGDRLNVLLVPDDPRFALPAAYWAANAGDALLFFDPSGALPPATRSALARRTGQARIYVLGPVVPPDLAGLGVVTRIGDADPVNTAVALARFRDVAHDLGWGLDGTRWAADHAVVLANPAYPRLAAAGIPLGRLGQPGPLLWTEPDHLATAVSQLLWANKPRYFVTPAEGPYNRVWILGGLDRITYATQGEAELSQQIEAYRFAGPGLSGFEAIWIVWIVWGVAVGLYLIAHSLVRFPDHDPATVASWGVLGLALGPIALGLYRLVYHRQPWRRRDNRIVVERVGLARTLAAAAMSHAVDGPLMLVLGWVLLAGGLPILVWRGPLFWVGNPMFLQIVLVYLAALLVHWLIMHTGMFVRHYHLPYRAALRRAFVPAVTSMTAMTVGMMGFMWWLQMINLMGEHMSRDDDLMWWGTTLASVLVGILVALPVDHWLVQSGRLPDHRVNSD